MKARHALTDLIKENDNLRWQQAQQTARAHPQWQAIRRAATDLLISHGAEEVGSSDINHAVFALYNQYGGDYDAMLVDMGVDRPDPQQSEIDRLQADELEMGEY